MGRYLSSREFESRQSVFSYTFVLSSSNGKTVATTGDVRGFDTCREHHHNRAASAALFPSLGISWLSMNQTLLKVGACF